VQILHSAGSAFCLSDLLTSPRASPGIRDRSGPIRHSYAHWLNFNANTHVCSVLLYLYWNWPLKPRYLLRRGIVCCF